MSRPRPRAGASAGCCCERLIAEAQALGFRQMIAVIGDGSPESPRSGCTSALGFRHCGRLEGSGYKHGRWLDTAFMQLADERRRADAARSGTRCRSGSFSGKV